MRAFLASRIGLSGREGADSLLVDGNTIAAVGTRDEIESVLPAGGERLHLGGGLILPGFQDAHVHLYHVGRNLARPALGDAGSLADALDRLRQYSRESEDSLLFGEGYDETVWPENRLPLRSELDLIESRRPLIARRVCGHIAVANDVALRGIPDGTPGVDRESGRLEEEVVFRLEQLYFPPSPGDCRRSIVRGQEVAFSRGVTTVHEFDIPQVFQSYQALDAEEGALRIRVRFFAWAPVEDVIELRRGGAGKNVQLVGAKVFTDGSLGGSTAALMEPYIGGGTGELLQSAPEIAAIFESADRADLPVALHAIGDRALEAVIEGRRLAGEEGGGRNLHRIEHLEVMSVERAAAAADLGFHFSMQPNFHKRWGEPGGMYDDRLGRNRTRALNRTGSWIRAGYPVAFGSDAMPLDPFYGLEGAVHHPEEEERISPETAIRHYTETAESFAPGDGRAGAIEPGARADFLWFDKSPVKGGLPAREDLRMTVAGGEIVYEK